MLSQASLLWQGGRVGSITVRSDSQGPLVEITRHDGDRLQYGPARLRFDGRSGRLQTQVDPQGPAIKTYGVLYGLHLGRFADTGMRWVLFGFGVLGSLMIASGLILWSVKRRAQALRKTPAAPCPLANGWWQVSISASWAACRWRSRPICWPTGCCPGNARPTRCRAVLLFRHLDTGLAAGPDPAFTPGLGTGPGPGRPRLSAFALGQCPDLLHPSGRQPASPGLEPGPAWT